MQFLLRPRMMLVLLSQFMRRAGLHLGPRHRCAAPRRGSAASDRAEHARRRRSVIARAAALAAPRGDRRRDRRWARVCRARADGRRLMNERDPAKDRRRRRFTPADIRQIRHHAPQCGLACWARHHPASTVANWKIVHKTSYAWWKIDPATHPTDSTDFQALGCGKTNWCSVGKRTSV